MEFGIFGNGEFRPGLGQPILPFRLFFPVYLYTPAYEVLGDIVFVTLDWMVATDVGITSLITTLARFRRGE